MVNLNTDTSFVDTPKMYNCNLIVLSYHNFTAEEDAYAFTRTYKQFRNDIETKDFDWITIDDGHASQIKACKMMQDANIRGKVFICPGLIGKETYCTWDEIWALSRFHDIENHSHDHLRLVTLSDQEIQQQINTAQESIRECTGRYPRYFVPPWNHFDNRVLSIVEDMGLQLIRNRITIKNTSP